MMDFSVFNTWIEISETAYSNNIKYFRNLIKKNTEFSVVIKANAYGHGLLQMAALAQKNNIQSFCVHSLEEVIKLRENGFEGDILIMGHVPLKRLKEAVALNCRVGLFNYDSLEVLAQETHKLNKPARIHLKLETGTNRLGIDQHQLPQFLKQINVYPKIILEGAYTHFSNIEDTTNHLYAYTQLEKFNKMIKSCNKFGFSYIKTHSACSAAILLFPETHFEMIRLGISQYGLWPSRETFVSYKIKHIKNEKNVLHPILSWKTRISQIKNVSANQYVGYGCTYQTTRDSRIAVLPIGYSDGYDRKLSNQGYVLIKGKRAPIRGRVCMNMIMVDITDIAEAKLEDEAVLIGRQGDEEIPVELLANLSGTINYEWISRINQQIPRFVV